MAAMKKKKKERNDILTTPWIVVFLVFVVIGPVYSVMGNLSWLLVFVVAVFAVLGGINWLFTRNR